MTRDFAMQSHFDGHTPPFWSELNTVAGDDVVAKSSQVRSAKKELTVWPDMENLMRSEAFTMSCTAMFPVGLDRRHPNRVRIGTKSATCVTSQAVSRQCSWTSTLHSVWGPEGRTHAQSRAYTLSTITFAFFGPKDCQPR